MSKSQIILTVHDKKGKNILFILDTFKALTINEMVEAIRKGQIFGVQIVKRKNTTYIRSAPNLKKEDNLDLISVSISFLKKFAVKKIKTIDRYLSRRNEFLKDEEKKGQKIIYIDGEREATEEEVTNYLSRFKKEIFSAAKDLDVDQYLLGAILIDEYLRRSKADDWFDWLAKLGEDTSVGIAQIKVTTARELIKKNYYNPAPNDKRFYSENIDKLPVKYLYEYLDNSKHSIYFAGAKLKQIIKEKSSKYDLRKLEHIADLYSRKDLAKTGVSNRGKQIAREFYEIAKKVLKP